MATKPNFMDSGTVLFKAQNNAEALRLVSEVLSRDGGKVVRKDNLLTLDFSSFFHTRLIEASVEPTSSPGTFAVSFREGNCGRLIRFALASRSAVRRMQKIRNEMKSYQNR